MFDENNAMLNVVLGDIGPFEPVSFLTSWSKIWVSFCRALAIVGSLVSKENGGYGDPRSGQGVNANVDETRKKRETKREVDETIVMEMTKEMINCLEISQRLYLAPSLEPVLYTLGTAMWLFATQSARRYSKLVGAEI